MKSGLGDMLRQAQALQEKMGEARRELADSEVTGNSGAGLVEVVMACNHDVKKVVIAPELMGGDKDVLEDLVAAAVNDAVQKVEAESQQRLGQMATGMLPGLKWPPF